MRALMIGGTLNGSTATRMILSLAALCAATGLFASPTTAFAAHSDVSTSDTTRSAFADTIAAPSAQLDGIDAFQHSASLSGSGLSGAIITVTAPGIETTSATVASSGAWQITILGLPAGETEVAVTQTIDGVTSAAALVRVVIDDPHLAPFQAEVTHIDHDARTALVRGFARAGSTITVAGTFGTTSFVTSTNEWQHELSHLTNGENTFTFTETLNGVEMGRVTVVTIVGELASPLVHPLVGAVGAAGATSGFLMLGAAARRRWLA